jgi:guanylate kinase
LNDLLLHPASPGLLLVLSAPSGAGKTTLARRLVENLDEAIFSVSYTTRAPRGRERDGEDYFFVDEATFDAMVAGGQFAEWANVHGSKYGTPRAKIDAQMRDRRVIVFDIDVQGGEQIQAAYPQAATVLIAPPSMEVLECRLRERSTEDEAAITRRLAAAREELRRGAATYRYLIVNDDLERAYAELEAVVTAERCRIDRLDREDWLRRIG